MAGVVPGQVVGTGEVERDVLVALVEAVAVVGVREEAVLVGTHERRLCGGRLRSGACERTVCL